MNIYIFSILDNLNNLFTILFGACIVSLILGAFVGIIMCEVGEDNFFKKLGKFMIRMVIGTVVCGIFMAVCPTQESLIKSYIVFEGKDIVTSENVEELIQWTDEKVDLVIQETFSDKKDVE